MFPVLFLHMLCRYYNNNNNNIGWFSWAAQQRRCKRTQQNCQGAKISVALLRQVMQDAVGAVFDVCPDVTLSVYVDDKQLNVRTEKGR